MPRPQLRSAVEVPQYGLRRAVFGELHQRRNRKLADAILIRLGIARIVRCSPHRTLGIYFGYQRSTCFFAFYCAWLNVCRPNSTEIRSDGNQVAGVIPTPCHGRL
jgi:hypothetical protein